MASAGYVLAILSVVIATLATFAIQPLVGPSVSLLFFPAVVLIAMYYGYGPSLLATVLSTVSLAYFFITPLRSFDVGTDDAIRLAVFAGVALITASFGAAKKRAEDAQRTALSDLRNALAIVRKVSDWPVLVDATLTEAVRELLDHAVTVVECSGALAVWEAEDEPLVYVARSSAASGPAITRLTSTDLTPLVPAELVTMTMIGSGMPTSEMLIRVSEAGRTREWHGTPMHVSLAREIGEGAFASAPFHVEHLVGRLFLTGLRSTAADVVPLVEVVAREVGNSLEQLYGHDRSQQIAIREDRVRLARDLHDGVLQSLTGVRFQLQALADDTDSTPPIRDHLLAIERAIAIEQRELRMFIEDLKPIHRRHAGDEDVGRSLAELGQRLSADWRTPIVVRVHPENVSLGAVTHAAIRLMVREAIINALKHARPSHVSVDVTVDGTRSVRAVVANDGLSFPFRGRLEHSDLIESSLAPVSLRDRVVAFGGTLAIESNATGSRIEIVLPLSPQGA